MCVDIQWYTYLYMPLKWLLAFNLLSTKSQRYYRPGTTGPTSSPGIPHVVLRELPEDVNIFPRVDSNPKSSMGREYLDTKPFPPLNVAIFHLMFFVKETIHSDKIWEWFFDFSDTSPNFDKNTFKPKTLGLLGPCLFLFLFLDRTASQ